MAKLMSHIKKNSALGLFSLPHSDKKHIPIINECSLTKGIDFAIICIKSCYNNAIFLKSKL